MKNTRLEVGLRMYLICHDPIVYSPVAFKSRQGDFMTRILDVVFSISALIVLLPIMLTIALILRFSGEGYILYLQPRIGRHGKVFSVYKFATMLKNSPSMDGGFVTQKHDPRVLPFGRFLRKTKINELPQLMNIVLGQMSLVGPRPIVKEHLDNYGEDAKNKIMELRPGLTGIASMIFRDEEGVLDRMPGDRRYNHDVIIAPYKGELEKWYAENQSLGLYFSILFWTAMRVIFPNSKAMGPRYKGLPEAPATIQPYL